MEPIHTHYDNLKVSRSAPLEVIRAAYRTLSQKYHPDRNLQNLDAGRVMAIINASYDVLSDPVKRAEHDRWIRDQEYMQREPGSVPSPAQPTPTNVSEKNNNVLWRISWHLSRFWYFYLIALVWILSAMEDKKPRPGPKPYIAQPTQEIVDPYDSKPEQTFTTGPKNGDINASLAATIPVEAPEPITTYMIPLFAPNGEAWPTKSGYIRGYPILKSEGLSTLTVDNSGNNSDVFVKLVSLDGPRAFPVRQFFIPAFATFTLHKVTRGSYDIRYRDLADGGLSRSEKFEAHQIDTPEGSEYSQLTMTLYKVRNGNSQSYPLAENEF